MFKRDSRLRKVCAVCGGAVIVVVLSCAAAGAQMGHMGPSGGSGMTGGSGMMGGGGMMGGWRSAPTGASGGKQIYASDCASCHRADGSGGMKFGDATSSDLRAPGLESLYHGDDRLIARAILRGIDQDGQALNDAMPRWQGTLSRPQVLAVVSYLKQLRK